MEWKSTLFSGFFEIISPESRKTDDQWILYFESHSYDGDSYDWLNLLNQTFSGSKEKIKQKVTCRIT